MSRLLSILVLTGTCGLAVAVPPLFEQPPTAPTGGNAYANMNAGGSEQRCAEDFTLASTKNIGSVDWWGFVYAPTSNSQVGFGNIVGFDVRIYAANGTSTAGASGFPGTLLYQQTIPMGSIATSVYGAGQFGGPVYQLSAQLATPFTAAAGTTYWIAINGVVSNTAFNAPLFAWLYDGTGPGRKIGVDGALNPVDGIWGASNGVNVALRLNEVTDSDGDGLNDADEIALGTNPSLADTDGDGLGDLAEVNAGGCPSPVNADSDGDGISDGAEGGVGTSPCNADSDGDGRSDGAEQASGGCSSPTNADSDGDGLNDGQESAAGTSACSADTDADGVGDAVEVNSGGCSNPLAADSDGDGLNDGQESAAGTSACSADTDVDGVGDATEVNSGGCSNPLVADSDGDGLSDGQEAALGTSACNADTDSDGVNDGVEVTLGGCWSALSADSDGDGLDDGQEVAIGTSVCTQDTDNDGLFDGTEVDLRTAGGCHDPLNPDSDSDTIDDGDEVAIGTNPCSADTDGDQLADALDPMPLVAAVGGDQYAMIVREASDMLFAAALTTFDGPNNNARAGRKNVLVHHLNNAAKAIERGDTDAALDLLDNVRVRMDGDPNPADWYLDPVVRDEILMRIDVITAIIGG